MKIRNKKTATHTRLPMALVAGSILLGNGADASMVQDMRNYMSSLLGHEVQVTNVYKIDELKLSNGKTKFEPWTGSYWPDINGGITNHYRDREFMPKLRSQILFGLRYNTAKDRFEKDHQNVSTNIKDNPRQMKWDSEELNKKLSPSEKYDLLLGDTQFTFTRAIMQEMEFRADHRITEKKRDGTESDSDSNEGDDPVAVPVDQRDDEGNLIAYSKYNKEVEYRYWRVKGDSLAYWSGICDGWSPASVYLPRPIKPVTVTGAKGHRITFYPDDLKALGSYLFARSNTNMPWIMGYRLAGYKCKARVHGNKDRDARDWISDVRCNDLDAGVFHLSLINRVALDGVGFMTDVDNNLKINNHPVSSYQMTYYNPVSGKEGSMQDSIALREEVRDRYETRRNPESKYILGVEVTVQYKDYSWPEDNRKHSGDSPDRDKTKEKHYAYDLELDAFGNILGGEWGDRSENDSEGNQPDFIWMANLDSLPTSAMAQYANAGLYKPEAWEESLRTGKKLRPFGTMNWAWDGKSPLPEDWMRAAKADEAFELPVVGKKITDENDVSTVVPEKAKNSNMVSTLPLSHIVYYLFDQARNPNQK